MLYLVLGICIALGVFGCYMVKKTQDDEWGWLIIPSFLIVLFLIIFIPVSILMHGKGLAQWQAFYNANTRNYEVTVDETASYLSQEEFTNVLIDGSIEKFKQAGYVSERIKEWRDAVNNYNTTIASMQYFNQNWFTGILVPDGVEDMKLLIIE